MLDQWPCRLPCVHRPLQVEAATFTSIGGALASAEVLTIDLDVTLRVAFAPREPVPTPARRRPILNALFGCMQRRQSDAALEGTSRAAVEMSTAIQGRGARADKPLNKPLALTVYKKGLSWFPVLVRVHDLRLRATVRLTADFSRHKLCIAFLPSGGDGGGGYGSGRTSGGAASDGAASDAPHVSWDVDTKLGLFPIPNWIDEELPRQLGAFLGSKFTAETPLAVGLDIPKLIYAQALVGTNLDPTVAAAAAPSTIDDASLEQLQDVLTRKAEHIKQILVARRAARGESPSGPDGESSPSYRPVD